MTDPRTRANRIVGKVQKSLPEIAIGTLRTAITREITEAMEEAGIPTVLDDPYRRDILQALESCTDLLLDEKVSTEDALLRAKQTLLPFFRGVGK